MRHLRNLPSDAEIPRFLEENDKYAKACGLSPLAIPHESQINRFKNQGITPLRLLAIFYFIVTVAITHKIVDSYLAAIDSSILDSHANPFHKTLTGNCKTCKYAADKGYDDKDNYHFVVNELKAEPVIPHREETKTSPSSELFRIKDQVYHVQIKDDLRIYGTPTTPKGSLQ